MPRQNWPCTLCWVLTVDYSLPHSVSWECHWREAAISWATRRFRYQTSGLSLRSRNELAISASFHNFFNSLFLVLPGKDFLDNAMRLCGVIVYGLWFMICWPFQLSKNVSWALSQLLKLLFLFIFICMWENSIAGFVCACFKDVKSTPLFLFIAVYF